MKLLRSMRARLLLGAVLWTIGLLPVAHVLSISLIVRFPVVVGLPRLIFVSHPAHGRDVFMQALLHYGGALAVASVFLVAGFLLIRSALAPMNRLRSQLSAVHEGRERRVDGTYPTEVQPLVNDLNQLLDHREETVRRALAKAGDLAHGLKTPLALLAREAERARASGAHEIAGAIDEQVERMCGQVDYHLAHARAAASGATPGTQCVVAASVEGLARTIERLHAGRGISLDVRVTPGDSVRVQREDLDEMVGNVLDNACKWANSRVALTSEKNDNSMVILVDDDGPGLAPSLREAVLQRGVRADEAAPGSGFGLAIVRDVAELYGGSILLEQSPLGGLRARLTLPAC
jgi:signal transduction histidine kinase